MPRRRKRADPGEIIGGPDGWPSENGRWVAHLQWKVTWDRHDEWLVQEAISHASAVLVEETVRPLRRAFGSGDYAADHDDQRRQMTVRTVDLGILYEGLVEFAKYETKTRSPNWERLIQWAVDRRERVLRMWQNPSIVDLTAALESGPRLDL